MIGVSQPCDDAWRQKMNEEMRRELLFHPEIAIEVRDSKYDNTQQAADIEYFMRRGVDLLVVCPNDAEAIDAAVSAVYNSGIPVIMTDRNVVSDNYTAIVSGDNSFVSELLGNYILEHMPEGGKVLELLGPPNTLPSQQRHEKFAQMLSDAGCYQLTSIHASWLWEKAETTMDSLLRTGYVPDMVVAQNDQMAQGAYAAADKLGISGIRFIGVDGMQGEGNGIDAIVDGCLEASFLYSPGGEEIIRLAVNILNGEPFERINTLPSALVDRHRAEVMQLQAKKIDHEFSTIDKVSKRAEFLDHQHNLERTLLCVSVVFLVVVIIFSIKLYRNYRIKKKLSIQLEEATRAKISFFTNVSHDFRTPLTLISAPIEKLQEEEDNLSPENRNLLRIARKNVEGLRHLVDQVLDFRKFESGKLELHLSAVDLSEAVQNWLESFYGLAQKRHINLEASIPLGSDFTTKIDVDKIERVFFNIIDNAIKFTPDYGTISVKLWREDDTIKLTMTDTGNGINVEHIQHIFDNFYQVDSANYEGSGIGLAVVKSFVELHGGTITAGNVEVGTGAIFTITLPILNVENTKVTKKEKATLTTTQILTEYAELEENEHISEEEILPVALVIDDNADVRQMIKMLLVGHYKVLTASNGQVGLNKALKIIPNVVICDVMMPVMNGLELCHRLKEEMYTSHIPVLMLTARVQDEERVLGHRKGADAYLAKPFSPQVLIAQLDALVQNHNRVRDFFCNDSLSTVSTSLSAQQQERHPEDIFLMKLREIIEKNLGNVNLGVELVSKELGMSQTQIYRKAKAVTAKSIPEIICDTRLLHARKFIAQGDMTISQIAYKVGFSSPAYFSKCYKEHFGVQPTASNL